MWNWIYTGQLFELTHGKKKKAKAREREGAMNGQINVIFMPLPLGSNRFWQFTNSSEDAVADQCPDLRT